MRVLLLSIVAAAVLMPSLAARGSNPVRGLKKLLAAMAGFSLLYWVLVMLVTAA